MSALLHVLAYLERFSSFEETDSFFLIHDDCWRYEKLILKVSKCAISILIQFGGERNKGVKKKRDREYFNLKTDAR